MVYQEQLRAKTVLESLSSYLKAPKPSIIVPEIIEQDSSEYYNIRTQQSEQEGIFIEKLKEIISEIEKLSNEKKNKIKSRLRSLTDFLQNKTDDGDQIINEILEKTNKACSKGSLKRIVNGLIKLSGIQKELELLQRRCDYKNFLLQKQAKVQARIDAELKLIELEKEIVVLNANWTEMKEIQRKAAEELESLQNSLAENQKKLEDLSNEKLNLEEYLSGFDKKNDEFLKTQENYQKKCDNLLEIRAKADKVSEDLKKYETTDDFDKLKAENLSLKDSIAELRKQVKSLQEDG